MAELQQISLGKLVNNTGQIAGVPKNPRQIRNEQYDKLLQSLKESDLTDYKPLMVYPQDGKFIVLGGNMRLRALRELKAESVSCIIVPEGTPAETLRKLVIIDNTEYGEYDWDAVANEWSDLPMDDWGLVMPWSEDPQEENSANEIEKEAHAKLEDRFVVPPFTVLNTRSGYWQERKKAWNNLIQDNGATREGKLSSAPMMMKIRNGVSVLDPVVAEVACRWFGIQGGASFDCFAGDTAFGYVASKLGMTFTGIELRKEQAEFNNEHTLPNAHYICDDGQNVRKHLQPNSQDLLFSCPPYFDLEVYSDLPNDASNQSSYAEFLAILENAFSGAIECLKENRFAVIVVGDIRDKKGFYRGFTDDVKTIFKKHGMQLYNEAIIIESVGTLPQRVALAMRNRKLGKCHQNMLVFYKGKPEEIQNNFRTIEYESEDLELFGVD